LMVLAHFFVPHEAIYGFEILGSLVLFGFAGAAFYGLRNAKAGDGSVLTLYFLAMLVLVPMGGLFLYWGLSGFGVI
jgi:hypothetical protein